MHLNHEVSIMLDVETVNRLLNDSVPFNRALGVQVESVAEERVTVLLAESPDRHNHVGTVHAVAQFGLGEVTSGTMTMMAFGDLQRQGYAPVVTNASVTYHKSARGQLRGEARFPVAEQQRIRDEIAAGGRPRFTIQVQLTDSQGEGTTSLRFEWTLLAPRSAKA